MPIAYTNIKDKEGLSLGLRDGLISVHAISGFEMQPQRAQHQLTLLSVAIRRAWPIFLLRTNKPPSKEGERQNVTPASKESLHFTSLHSCLYIENNIPC